MSHKIIKRQLLSFKLALLAWHKAINLGILPCRFKKETQEQWGHTETLNRRFLTPEERHLQILPSRLIFPPKLHTLQGICETKE